jgi:uncharacterized protein
MGGEGRMRFEYDPNKSDANKAKHGIDFEEAQALWDDMERVEVPARTEDEPRTLTVGRIGDKHWSAIVTYRADSIWIISVRRARQQEVTLYEGEGIR